MTIDAVDGWGEGAEDLIRHHYHVYFSWPDKPTLPVPSSRALDGNTNERWIAIGPTRSQGGGGIGSKKKRMTIDARRHGGGRGKR